MTTEPDKPLDRFAVSYYLGFSIEMIVASEAPNFKCASGKNNPNTLFQEVAVRRFVKKKSVTSPNNRKYIEDPNCLE